MEDATRRFAAIDNRTVTREILSSVYDALRVKGYNPINQLVGISFRGPDIYHELQ